MIKGFLVTIFWQPLLKHSSNLTLCFTYTWVQRHALPDHVSPTHHTGWSCYNIGAITIGAITIGPIIVLHCTAVSKYFYIYIYTSMNYYNKCTPKWYCHTYTTMIILPYLHNCSHKSYWSISIFDWRQFPFSCCSSSPWVHWVFH